MPIEIKAPGSLNFSPKLFTIFLAGSIEQGFATDWQKNITNSLSDYDIVILNPRRSKWDNTLEQSMGNNEFSRQVNWELSAINRSDIIFFHFEPKTVSPISLLELGLCLSTQHIIVSCPEGYFRKGNIDITCNRYNVKVHDSIEQAKIELIRQIELSEAKRLGHR